MLADSTGVIWDFKPPSDFSLSNQGQQLLDQPNLELLLIQVPKKFDIGLLNGVKCTPGEIIDIARDDSLPGQLSAVYKLAANAEQDLDLKPLVKHNNELLVGKSVSGHVSVTKSYSVESKPSQYTLPSLRRPGPSLVPMPAGLKERFTPFGSVKERYHFSTPPSYNRRTSPACWSGALIPET
ncbi:hypothetical protein ElyMa_001189700 [Elysia marginata]|uniref:Uncharacterized protein n=1 Tax=Elysia marginata TaxID=1093978 RepID=A0AAV4I3N3_9GAST|nr:hypothetical protein ElyMa_001189700 [Elysia marginata]